jgi:uncharacterized RDD family membrane protein YckC
MVFCSKCGKELPEGAIFCPNCGASVQASATASAPSPPISGFETLTKDQKAQQHWILRLIAFIIDAVIVYLILAVLTFLVALPALFTGGLGIFAAFFGGVSIVWGIIFVLYFAFAESTYGASIGKHVLGLKVVSKTNTKPNFAEAFIRSLSKIYWILLLLDVVIGLAISRGYQQKLSDYYMGTTVNHV